MSGRTESRQAAHYNDVLVAPFAWNAEEDAQIPSGFSYLYGEVPAGSIVFGGFVQVVEEVQSDHPALAVTFTIGGVTVYSITGSVTPGWYPLDVSRFEDPTENFPVNSEPGENRMLVEVASGPVSSGEFCIYLFYVNDELGPFGQVEHPIGLAMAMMAPPPLLGIPAVPVADVPSLVPPAPLPELPTPRAWYRRARYPRTTPIIPPEE